MATESVKVIKIDTEAGQKSVKEMRDRLKELKDVLVSTESGTESYSKAMAEAADISHQLKDMQQELAASAMDFGQVANNCTNVVKGMAGGLQSASAIMTIFGKESEDVVKAIQKMQSSMALIQGLTAMESGFKSLNRLLLRYISTSGAAATAAKVLQAAMQPKVLLAISAAIAGVVLLYNKLTASSKKAAEEQKKLNEEWHENKKRLIDEYADSVKNLQSRIEQLKSSLDKRSQVQKWTDEISDNTLKIAYNEGQIKNLNKQIEDYRTRVRLGWKVTEEMTKRFEDNQKAVEVVKEENKKLTEANVLLQQSIDNFNTEQAAEKFKKLQEVQRAAAIEAMETARVTQEVLNNLFDERSLAEKYKDAVPVKVDLVIEEEDDEGFDKWLQDRVQAYADANEIIGITAFEELDAIQAHLNQLYANH